MRELKFRAWSNDYDAYCSEIRYDADIWDGYVVDETGLEHHTSDITIEQYTGLKDKNGKEIYEGDIVKIAGVKQHFIFVWDDDELGFLLEDKNKRRYVVWDNKYQVIGNIHENKELLEGE